VTALLIWISRRRVSRAKRLWARGDAIIAAELAYWERRLGRRL